MIIKIIHVLRMKILWIKLNVDKDEDKENKYKEDNSESSKRNESLIKKWSRRSMDWLLYEN